MATGDRYTGAGQAANVTVGLDAIAVRLYGDRTKYYKIRRFMKLGLPFTKAGRAFAVDNDVLDEWLENHTWTIEAIARLLDKKPGTVLKMIEAGMPVRKVDTTTIVNNAAAIAWAEEWTRRPRYKPGKPLIDLTGQRFGMLTVIERAATPPGKVKATYWRCRCDCGGEKIAHSKNMRLGAVKSCGCLLITTRRTFSEGAAFAMRERIKAIFAFSDDEIARIDALPLVQSDG